MKLLKAIVIQFQGMASQERMRDLTVQVKRNTEDLNSYLQDLEGWQKDMEAKDNQLRGKTTSEPTGVSTQSHQSYWPNHIIFISQ